jgi:nucleoside-diphosphate-sugar epimerase
MVETMTLNPMSPYATHKLIGEEYCALFSKIYGLSTICLRYMNVFGKRQDPEGEYANLLPKFIRKMSEGEIPTIFGDGEQTRDFVSVDDVVNANILAAKSKYVGVINIGSGIEMSVNQISQIIQEKLNVNVPPIHGPAVIEPRRVVGNITKAKEILNWKPKINFNEGIERMIKNGRY